MIPYDEDSEKRGLVSAGRTKDLSTKSPMQNKTGLNEMDGEEVNFLPADFKRRFIKINK